MQRVEGKVRRRDVQVIVGGHWLSAAHTFPALGTAVPSSRQPESAVSRVLGALVWSALAGSRDLGLRPPDRPALERARLRAPEPYTPAPAVRLRSATAMGRPKRFPDRDEVAAVRARPSSSTPGATDTQTKRRLAGRVMARAADMGKLVFLDLVDRSGRIQLICPAERTGELDLHLGDVVGVTGSPAQSRRGEPSLQVDELEVLARIRAPLPDTFHGIEDVELRYRKRYLDLLMSEESRDEVIKRARMVSAIRAYLDGEGFLEVETPILQPRYGGGFAEPFVTRSELLDARALSPHRRRALSQAADRRRAREGLRALEGLPERELLVQALPEFTQVEWYEAYADYKDTAARLKELVAGAARSDDRHDEGHDFRGHEVDLIAVAGDAVRRGA